jgi:hypothetical protein
MDHRDFKLFVLLLAITAYAAFRVLNIRSRWAARKERAQGNAKPKDLSHSHQMVLYLLTPILLVFVFGVGGHNIARGFVLMRILTPSDTMPVTYGFAIVGFMFSLWAIFRDIRRKKTHAGGSAVERNK